MINYTKILILLIVMTMSTEAADIKTTASVDTNGLLIGERIPITLYVEAPKDYHVVWPDISDTLGMLEIIKRTNIDTLDDVDKLLLNQKLMVTTFDSGSYKLPAFTWMYSKPGHSTLFPAKSKPLKLNFTTVQVDTTEPMKDIHPIIDEPIKFAEVWPLILIILLIIAAIVLAYFWWKKRNKKQIQTRKPQPEKPKAPAHILAFAELDDLEKRQLWQNNQVKKYYIELTEILRRYIERRYGMMALEMTSDEILSKIWNYSVKEENVKILEEVLTIGDLTKFAKHTPSAEDNEKCMDYARQYINKTKKFNLENQPKGVKE